MAKLLVINGPNLNLLGVRERTIYGLMPLEEINKKIIAHAERLILMQNGKIIRDGIPADIMTDIEAFGVRKPCAFRLGLEAESWLS